MSDHTDDSQAVSRFIEFINTQLDLSALSESETTPSLTEADIEQRIMPLIRGDIRRETLRIVAHLLSSPERDHWRAQLAPFHREIRVHLAQNLGSLLEQRYPERLSEAEWEDAATFIITMAWLVRKQMDSDEPPSSAN